MTNLSTVNENQNIKEEGIYFLQEVEGRRGRENKSTGNQMAKAF